MSATKSSPQEPSSPTLTPSQSAALFDILTHRALYNEITAFKLPTALDTYGPPFQQSASPSSPKSTSPILQTLLARFILTLPGLKSVAPDFWRVRVKSIIQDLAAAELSESYDKGVLGIRKTVTTAISALVEYPARGVLGGLPRNEDALRAREYDRRDADDVTRAFQAFVQQLVYGGLWDELFAKTAETDQLRQHGSLLQAAHEFIVLNLASFMHYTLILSPEGPSLLRLGETLHKLIPYMLIRQTLKIGNVATMISGMVRLLLAKLSVSTVTNWFGLSKDADEGMNLLQQIINQVLSWDNRDFKKRLEKLEKDKDVPSKEVRKAIDDWIKASRQEHDETRRQSQEQGMSIVATILSLSSASTQLSETQHAKALEYLRLHLSIRDRTEITRVLCRSNPDQLTQAIREGVAAYEPIIRQVHEAVDLSGSIWDLEQFITDTIKTSKPSKAGEAPSVENFVELLHRHQDSLHRFLHQVAKNGTEVTKWFKGFAVNSCANFKADDGPEKTQIKDALKSSLKDLSEEEHTTVRTELDAYSKYLEKLHASSASRIKDVIANKSSTAYGPGAYLARWQELLDSTDITPDSSKGEVRKGVNKTVKAETRKDTNGEQPESGVDVKEADQAVGEKTLEYPDMQRTIQLLLPRFRQILLDQTSTKGLEV